MTALALEVPLRREDALHFLGYRGQGAPAARTESALDAALAEARDLVAPRGVHRIVPRECAAVLELPVQSGPCIALGLVTIGPALERRVSELLARGEDTRALLLDAAGSAAAEEAADELERRIHVAAGSCAPGEGAAGPGAAGPAAASRRKPRRVSPGYGAWPLTAQRALFDLMPHDEIGVRLLTSCLMVPRKTVSFAVWLDERVGAATEEGAASESSADSAARPGRCASCDSTTCPYREETPARGESS